MIIALPAAASPFTIQFLDDQTHQPVPLVELRTTDNQLFITDSAGRAAITPPELQNQKIYFSIKSHGYEYPADGFGYRGIALQVTPDKSIQLQIHRLNIAQRLYRITGAGIYRDTILAGKQAPIDQPLLNAQVVGQDSVQAVVLGNTIHFFYGDTSRFSYPLGNFSSSGATAPLDKTDPSIGINLTYFTDKNGFSRGMVNIPGPGAKWIDGLFPIHLDDGATTIAGTCLVTKDLGHPLSRHLILYDLKSNTFSSIKNLPLTEHRHPQGQAFLHTDNGIDYVYFATAYPILRVRPNLKSLEDPSAYEAFTCLKPGSRFSRTHVDLDRSPDGKLLWSWKPDTDPITESQQEALIQSGQLRPEDRYFHCVDAQTGKPIRLHAGSVNYNAYRKCWIMIAVQTGGASSMLGEVYYAEAPHPEGPWPKAVKIITHDHYSFYNPVHHPFFDQNAGQFIYFEGTYSATFSHSGDPTPLYDYNQIMYRLDLADPRLNPAHTNQP